MNSAQNQISWLESRIEKYFLEYSTKEHGRCSTNAFPSFSSLFMFNLYLFFKEKKKIRCCLYWELSWPIFSLPTWVVLPWEFCGTLCILLLGLKTVVFLLLLLLALKPLRISPTFYVPISCLGPYIIANPCWMSFILCLEKINYLIIIIIFLNCSLNT